MCWVNQANCPAQCMHCLVLGPVGTFGSPRRRSEPIHGVQSIPETSSTLPLLPSLAGCLPSPMKAASRPPMHPLRHSILYNQRGHTDTHSPPTNTMCTSTDTWALKINFFNPPQPKSVSFPDKAPPPPTHTWLSPPRPRSTSS